MRLIGHIIAKDLRQGKWALGFWVLLYAAHWAVGFAFLKTDGRDLEWIDHLRWAGLLLTIFEYAIGYLLALRWVQADDLSGTRMFWVTRPISGGRLLAAKGLGLLLVFGLLPILLWLPWWVSCGVGAREIGWLAVEMFGWQLLVIAPALLIGSLTDDFGRAIMWSLILVVAMLAWSILGQGTLTSADFRQFARGFAGLWFSRLCVAGALLVAGFLAIAACQYYSRNFLRSVVRVAVLGFVIILVGRFWVIDFADEVAGWGHPFASDVVSGAGENISLAPKKARLSAYIYHHRVGARMETMRSLIVGIEVKGQPEGTGLMAHHRAQALLWDDGQSVQITESSRSSTSDIGKILRDELSLPAAEPDPETLAWGRVRQNRANVERAAKNLPPLDYYWERVEEEQSEMRVFLRISESQLARVKLEPPAYTARIDASLFRPEILQQAPLEPGNRGTGAMRSLRVIGWDDFAMSIRMGVDNHVLQLMDTTPVFLRDGLFRVRPGQPSSTRFRTSIWTVNRFTGDIESVSRRSRVPTMISVGGVAIAWNEITLHPSTWIRNGKWVIKDPDWRKNTLLVMTVETVVGHFTRTVRSEPLAVLFPPEPAPAGNTHESSAATGGN